MMNVVAAYKEQEQLSLDELRERLGLKSRGHASDLVNGKYGLSRPLAERLSQLTGKPWYELIDAHAMVPGQ